MTLPEANNSLDMPAPKDKLPIPSAETLMKSRLDTMIFIRMIEVEYFYKATKSLTFNSDINHFLMVIFVKLIWMH